MVTLVKGTVVGEANANTYATVAEIRAYALDRGYDLTDIEDDTIASWAIRAMDYLNVYFGNKWKGVRSFITQALDWPRSDVIIDELEYDVYLPTQLRDAVSALVVAQFQGVSLVPVNQYLEQAVQEETFGPMTFRYFEPPNNYYKSPTVQTMLSAFLNTQPFLSVERA